MDEAQFLTQAAVERCAASAAEDGREQIERGKIWMCDFRHVPREGEARQFSLEFAVFLATTKLRWLARHEHIRQRTARMLFKKCGELCVDGVRIHIADDDEEYVVRCVAGAVVGDEVVACDLVEDIEMADDWIFQRMRCERGGEDLLPGNAVGIIVAHRKLAPNHLALLFQLIGGERGIHQRIGEQIERRLHAARRDINPIHRAVERRVGVDVAAVVLHRAREVLRCASRRAFEKHVLQQVRKTRAEPFAFVDAPGFHPRLHARNGRRRIFLHDEFEAVWQGESAGGDGRQCEFSHARAVEMARLPAASKDAPRCGENHSSPAGGYECGNALYFPSVNRGPVFGETRAPVVGGDGAGDVESLVGAE